MSTKEASRRASADFHAKRKAEGWRKVTVWLSPSAVARLDTLKAAHGYGTDEAIRRLLNCSAADAPPAETPIKALLKAADVPSLAMTTKGGKLPEVKPVRALAPYGSRLKHPTKGKK